MKELLNRASQIVKEIDKMENIPKPIQVDKGIQSDQDDGYRLSQNIQYNHNNSPPRYDNREYDERQLPYDPEKNKSYYSSLNNSNNNIIQNLPNSRRVFNSTRVKRMDNLYQGRQSNRTPFIYSQIEMNGSYPTNDSFGKVTNNNSSYGYSQMPGPQPRQYERYRPGNVSNSMDILLNNHEYYFNIVFIKYNIVLNFYIYSDCLFFLPFGACPVISILSLLLSNLQLFFFIAKSTLFFESKST